MIWYVFCYYGYCLPDLRVINVDHLFFVELDTDKRYNGSERHCISSVNNAPYSSGPYGCYMSMREIVPVQFFPRPISIATYFGLEYADKLRLNPDLLSLLTCKTDVNPRNRRTWVGY